MKKLFLYFILCLALTFLLESNADRFAYSDSPFPVIRIVTENSTEVLSREEYVRCTVDVFNCRDSYTLINAAAGIKVRGNSTAYYGDPEQIRANGAPYRIQFDQKLNMLGLNDEALCRSWVLLQTGEWLIFDEVAFRMGRAILDDEQFCSDSAFVRLYINDEFRGLYLLCEQSQVQRNRVNIHEPQEGQTGVQTGYFLEIDNYAAQEPDNVYFEMRYGDALVTDIAGTTRAFRPTNYSVKSSINSPAQLSFIENHINGVFSALYEACINGNYLVPSVDGTMTDAGFTSARQVAEHLLNLDSVVNMYILYELVHDYDAGDGSFYMTLDLSADSANRKLTFTCPWDFDWAYEGEPAGQYYAGVFCSEEFMEQAGDRSNPWFILLMTQDWFVDLVKERWTQLRIDGTLHSCLEEERNFLKAHADALNAFYEDSPKYAASILDWLDTRIQWLDGEWLL